MISLPTVDVLNSIAIPVACPVPWDEMDGDNRTRFCSKCSQNVHDVSELTNAETMRLLTDGDKLPCLRIYRRQDGRVMTADCATKRERVWKWLHGRSAWAASLFAVVFLGGCGNQLGTMMGVPCHIPNSHQKFADDQTEEHASRSVVTAEDTDRVGQPGAVDVTDAHSRQESAAKR